MQASVRLLRGALALCFLLVSSWAAAADTRSLSKLEDCSVAMNGEMVATNLLDNKTFICPYVDEDCPAEYSHLPGEQPRRPGAGEMGGENRMPDFQDMFLDAEMYASCRDI